MSTIAFRAWDTEAELWRYFELEDAVNGRLVKFAHCLETPEFRTRIKDREGLYIYTGDIICDEDDDILNYVVELDPQDDTFCAHAYYQGVRRDARLLAYEMRGRKVIGNTKQNPGLIGLKETP